MIPFLLIWYIFLKPRNEDRERGEKKRNFNPYVHWRSLEQQVTSAVQRYGYECERLEYIINETADYKRKFDQMWQSCKKRNPLLLFHGTLEKNVAGIRERGLLVPSLENGVAVSNGSLHGVGIYFTNANGVMTSLGYCDRSKLILCAVIPHDELLLIRGDVHVAFNSALVLPCFLVHLRYVGPRFQTYNPVKDYNPIDTGTCVETSSAHIDTFSSRTVYLVFASIIFVVLLLMRSQGYSVPALDLLQYFAHSLWQMSSFLLSAILKGLQRGVLLEALK